MGKYLICLIFGRQIKHVKSCAKGLYFSLIRSYHHSIPKQVGCTTPKTLFYPMQVNTLKLAINVPKLNDSISFLRFLKDLLMWKSDVTWNFIKFRTLVIKIERSRKSWKMRNLKPPITLFTSKCNQHQLVTFYLLTHLYMISF